MNQYALSLTHPGRLCEHPIGREDDGREDSGLLQIYLACECIQGKGEGGQCWHKLRVATTEGESCYGLPNTEPFHPFPQCSNSPGNLIARNKRQGWAMASLARPQIGIVHACIGNLDQDLSRSWLPNGHIASFKHLWPAEARYHYSFHQCLCPFLSLSLPADQQIAVHTVQSSD